MIYSIYPYILLFDHLRLQFPLFIGVTGSIRTQRITKIYQKVHLDYNYIELFFFLLKHDTYYINSTNKISHILRGLASIQELYKIDLESYRCRVQAKVVFDNNSSTIDWLSILTFQSQHTTDWVPADGPS